MITRKTWRWVKQQGWENERETRLVEATQASEVIRTFRSPVGPRVQNTKEKVIVWTLQGRPDAFHHTVKHIARAALVDLLELRSRTGPSHVKPPEHRLFRCKGCGGEAGEILESSYAGPAGSAFHLKPEADINRRPAQCPLFQRLDAAKFLELHRDQPSLPKKFTRWER